MSWGTGFRAMDQSTVTIFHGVAKKKKNSRKKRKTGLGVAPCRCLNSLEEMKMLYLLVSLGDRMRNQGQTSQEGRDTQRWT